MILAIKFKLSGFYINVGISFYGARVWRHMHGIELSYLSDLMDYFFLVCAQSTIFYDIDIEV